MTQKPKRKLAKMRKTAMPVGPVSNEHKAILEAVDATGMSDIEMCRMAGTAKTFLSKARTGDREGAISDGSWRLVKIALSKVPGSAFHESEKPDPEKQKLLNEFVERSKQVSSLTQVDALLSLIPELQAKGVIGPNDARAYTTLFKERRQTLQAMIQEKKLAQAGEPLRVVIEYTNDWEEDPV